MNIDPPAKTTNEHLNATVARIVARTPVHDIHTHLFPPAFGDLMLWGIDDLLVYHYMVAEAFRYLDLPYERFFQLPKSEQAEIIWNELFIRHSPLSEACRGVLTTLNLLGLAPHRRDLQALRQWFKQWQPDAYVDHCMQLAGVKTIYMTNSPFDDAERRVWDGGFTSDSRFNAGLRIDQLLLDWPNTALLLARWGYKVEAGFGGQTLGEVRRFLSDWTKRMNARYVMVSLPPTFCYPDHSACTRLIEGAVLPHCREFGQPFALMIGVIRAVNPQLGMAGDGMGRADLTALANLCAAHPDSKFLSTVLARENQQELCVLARKFRNLHIFGCWWFVNIPSLIEEITRMRVELLGSSFTAQHSDARILDQILYKWNHSRTIVTRVLTEKYSDLAATGWSPTEEEIERDVSDMLGEGFERFLASS